jgi:uncharacterized caspase-like protein
VNARAEQLPDLFDCIDPAIAEAIIARNALVEQMAMLEFRLTELTQCRAQRQAVSLSLSAEALASTAFQIREMALTVHRSIAKRLNLEVRI